MKTYSIIILTDNHTDVFNQLSSLPEAKTRLKDKSNIPQEHGIQYISYYYQAEKRLLFWIISSNNKYFLYNLRAHSLGAQDCIIMYRFNALIDGKIDPLLTLKEAYHKWNSADEAVIFNISHPVGIRWFHQYILDFSQAKRTFYASFSGVFFNQDTNPEKDVKDLTFEEVFENTSRIAQKISNKFG